MWKWGEHGHVSFQASPLEVPQHQSGKRVCPYLDCAPRQRIWGRTSLLHT